MAGMKTITLRLDEIDVAIIEKCRGAIPRETFLRALIHDLDRDPEPAIRVHERQAPRRRGGSVEVAHDEAGAYLRPAAETHPFLGVGKRCGRCGNERGGYSHP